MYLHRYKKNPSLHASYMTNYYSNYDLGDALRARAPPGSVFTSDPMKNRVWSLPDDPLSLLSGQSRAHLPYPYRKKKFEIHIAIDHRINNLPIHKISNSANKQIHNTKTRLMIPFCAFIMNSFSW